MFALRTVLLILIVTGPIGCSKDNGKGQVPVQGTITLDGQPLPGVVVRFIPVGSTPGFGSMGRSGPDGGYTLKGNQGGTGATPGSYKVVLSKLVQPDGQEVPENSTQSPMDLKATETLPPHYSQPEKTLLTANVPAGGGTIDFPLKKPKKKGR